MIMLRMIVVSVTAMVRRIAMLGFCRKLGHWLVLPEELLAAMLAAKVKLFAVALGA